MNSSDKNERRLSTSLDNLVSASDRLAALEKNAQETWKLRIQTKDDCIKTEKKDDAGGIRNRLNQLEKSSEQWRKRVEKNDAYQLTISHKMARSAIQRKNENYEKTEDISYKITKEEKYHIKSSDLVLDDRFEIIKKLGKIENPVISDDVFNDFFIRSGPQKSFSSDAVLEDLNFDDIIRNESNGRLFFRKVVPLNRKHKVSSNPIRALQKNDQIRKDVYENGSRSFMCEFVDGKEPLYEASLARFKLQFNVQSVPLKKVEQPVYTYPLLIQIKGRRHPIVKLVEPHVESINKGDDFILVTFKKVFYYKAEFTNVIERAIASELATYIIDNTEFSISKNSVLVIVSEYSNEIVLKDFWNALGGNSTSEAKPAGNPDEDMIFESCLIKSNQIFEVQSQATMLLSDISGRVPKYALLTEEKVLVFDFGSELYLWIGKNASSELRSKGSTFLQDRWNEPFDADQYDICPITLDLTSKTKNRPTWGLCRKLNHNLETCLFKKKFADWPAEKKKPKLTQEEIGNYNFSPDDVVCGDVMSMIEYVPPQPDLVLEMTHLGRGDLYVDEDGRRMFKSTTVNLDIWLICENDKKPIDNNNFGHMYAESTYVIKWSYRVECSGRTLKGDASKHKSPGRERTAYFFWHGASSSISDRGTSALMTIELKEEGGPLIRVPMLSEPPAFLNLFNGGLVIFSKKFSNLNHRMFVIRGETEGESHIIEVELTLDHFKSMGCVLVINIINAVIYVWKGCNANERLCKIARHAAQKLLESQCDEFKWKSGKCVVREQQAGQEEQEFKDIFGTASECIPSRRIPILGEYTPKFWKINSLSEEVQLTPVLSSHRHTHFTPFPIYQESIYQANQPALFLIDTGIRIWIWQGWWPEELEDLLPTESALRHFQFLRLTAYETAIEYAAVQSQRHKEQLEEMESFPIEPELIFAGQESSEFKSIFPYWKIFPEISSLLRDERNEDKKLFVKDYYEKLCRRHYTMDELTSFEKPDGIDQLHLEKYLNDTDFEEAFKMKRIEFYQLPSWKQLSLKKECGLY